MSKDIPQPESPRVAIVAELFPTVSETFVMHHITALMELGFCVDIYAFGREVLDEYGHAALQSYSLAETVVYLPENLEGSLAAEEFSKQNYAVVHCHFGDVAKRLVPLVPLMPDTRFLITFHGCDIRAAREDQERYVEVFDCFDWVVSICDYNKKSLLELGCPNSRIIDSPNTVDTAVFHPREARSSAGELVNIVTVARLHPDKNIAFALRVMRILLNRGLSFHYRVLGHGVQRDSLERQIVESGLTTHVSLLGQCSQEQVLQQLQAADVYFLPSQREAAPVCLLEAQSVGLPVVATLVGGINEIVDDTVTGKLVLSNDEEAAAQAIFDLAASASMRQCMGKSARQYMQDKYDYRSVNRKLFALYGPAPLPRVSVIIPTYNRARFIGDALESVLQQTFQSFEIIVIDDGSTDDTRAVVDRYRHRFPGVIHYYYRDKENAAAARNAGVAKSHGEYLAFLDSDDYWYPDKLRLQVALLDDRPELGFVHTQRDILYTEYYVPHGMLPIPEKLSLNSADLLRGDCQVHMTVLIRRFLFEQVGGFDVGLETTHDTDLWLRLAVISELAAIEDSQVCVRLHDAHLSTSDPERKLRNRIVVIERARKLSPDSKSDAIWRHRYARTILELSRECLIQDKSVEAGRLAREALLSSPVAGRTLFVQGESIRSRFKKLLKPYMILLRAGMSG